VNPPYSKDEDPHFKPVSGLLRTSSLNLFGAAQLQGYCRRDL